MRTKKITNFLLTSQPASFLFLSFSLTLLPSFNLYLCLSFVVHFFISLLFDVDLF
jgi:hypothetical protein